MPAASTLKQKAHDLIEQLPDDATWEDLIEQARFRQEVEAGIAAADCGEFATDVEVRAEFAKWGVKPCGSSGRAWRSGILQPPRPSSPKTIRPLFTS